MKHSNISLTFDDDNNIILKLVNKDSENDELFVDTFLIGDKFLFFSFKTFDTNDLLVLKLSKSRYAGLISFINLLFSQSFNIPYLYLVLE